VRILLVAEFWDCSGSDIEANAACNALVEGSGADPDDTWWYWIVLVLLFTAFRSLALIVLRAKAAKFL